MRFAADVDRHPSRLANQPDWAEAFIGSLGGASTSGTAYSAKRAYAAAPPARKGLHARKPRAHSQPTTVASFQANEATPPISYGIALDSVTAVSFMAGGQEVTLPVKNNVWAYEGDNSAIDSLTVHFDDGSTEMIK